MYWGLQMSLYSVWPMVLVSMSLGGGGTEKLSFPRFFFFYPPAQCPRIGFVDAGFEGKELPTSSVLPASSWEVSSLLPSLSSHPHQSQFLKMWSSVSFTVCHSLKVFDIVEWQVNAIDLPHSQTKAAAAAYQREIELCFCQRQRKDQMIQMWRLCLCFTRAPESLIHLFH